MAFQVISEIFRKITLLNSWTYLQHVNYRLKKLAYNKGATNTVVAFYLHAKTPTTCFIKGLLKEQSNIVSSRNTIIFISIRFPANIRLFKVNTRNIRKKVWSMFKVTNNIRTTCLYCWLWEYMFLPGVICISSQQPNAC